MKFNDNFSKNYNFGGLIRNMAEGRKLTVERDISETIAKESGLQSRGVFVPDIVFRDLTTSSNSAGGYSVGTDVGTWTDALRPKSILLRLGAQTVTGLVGNQSIPSQTSTVTAAWVPETGSATRSALTVGQVAMTPHRLTGQTAYSKQLLLQGDSAIARAVSNDITRVIGTMLDQAGINGTGAGGQPLGILHTSGVLTTSFGGAATQTKLAAFEAAVANANSTEQSLGWATSPNVRQKLRVLPEDGTGSPIVWRDGKVLDYPALCSTNVSGNQVIYGDFSQAVFGLWGQGIDILVDPYTSSLNGMVIVTFHVFADFGLLQPQAFIASTDSGAQ